jgi:hypothetical protein
MGSTKYFAHDGGNEGFVSQYTASFDGQGVVIMANSDNYEIFEEITYSVASVYDWKDHRPARKNVVLVSDTVSDSYIGKYVVNGGDLDGEEIAITKKDSNLFLNFRNMSWRVYFTSDTDFFIFEVKADFKLLHNSHGEVSSLSMYGGSVVADRVE